MSHFPTPSDQPGAQQRPFEHPYTLHGAGLRDTRTVDLSPCATIMRAHRDTTPHAHQRRDQPARSRALPPPSRHLAATAPRRSSCAALHTLREESAASESGQSTPRSPLRPERGPQPAARSMVDKMASVIDVWEVSRLASAFLVWSGCATLPLDRPAACQQLTCVS